MCAEQCRCSIINPQEITEIREKLTGDLEIARMSEIFQCFADPTRLKIINSLLLTELCVCDLVRVMQMSQPAVSHHLKNLRQMRLVKSRRSGKSIFYSLDDGHIREIFSLCLTHLNEKKQD